MSNNRFACGFILIVRQVEFLRGFPYNFRDFGIVNVADVWENMMLHLMIQPTRGGEAASPGGELPAASASAVSEELRALEAQAAAPFEEIGAVLAALDKDIAAVWGD